MHIETHIATRSIITHLIVVLILIFLPITVARAQALAGQITDQNGDPITGAAVIETNTLHGAVSDAEGHFSLRYDGRFPTQLVVRCIGFAPDTLTVERRSRDIKIVMNIANVESKEIQIVGDKFRGSFERIDAHLAEGVPGSDGGIETVIKSQLGVSSNSELSSQYRVRGGNFDENLVYVNGIEIYRPFLIRAGEQEGLSFVNPDMVGELQFSAGGFDASYGDKMSSVLDVTYKTPSKNHFGVRASLLGASAHAEGSAIEGRLTHISGLRYKTNQYLFGSLDTRGDYAPIFFDIQTYWTLRPSERVRIGLLAYYASNKYRFVPQDRNTSFGTYSDAKQLSIYFEGRENDHYRTCVVAANADYHPTDNLSLGLTASMFRTEEEEYYDILGEYWLQQAMDSQSKNAIDQSQNIGVGAYMQHARNNLFGEVYSVALRSAASTSIANIKAQLKMTREHYSDYTDEWEYTDSAGYMSTPGTGMLTMHDMRNAHNALWQTRAEGYIVSALRQIELSRGSLLLTSGFRIAHQTMTHKTVYSPRFSLQYLRNSWRLRIASGRYDQLPNLREMKRGDATLNSSLKPQRSWQMIGGADIFFDLADRPMKFTAETYYKWMRQLNPYSIDNVRIRYEADNNAKGYAAGVDFKLNGELVKGAESWVTLSIMQTKEDIEEDGHGSIPRPSDQRIQFSMMLQDYMPNNKSITAMLSLYMGSGLPFGPSGCERWQATNRMSGYKRVDLGLYKDFAVNGDGKRKYGLIQTAKLGIEIFNLFDNANTISHFWVSDNEGHRFGVPNYLTSRRINVRFSLEL